MRSLWFLPIGLFAASIPHVLAAQCCPVGQSITQLNNVASASQQLRRSLETSRDLRDTYQQTRELQQATQRQPEIRDAHEYYREQRDYQREVTKQHLWDASIMAPLEPAKMPTSVSESYPDSFVDDSFNDARESSRKVEEYSDKFRSTHHRTTYISSDENEYVETPRHNSNYEHSASDDTPHVTSQSKGDVANEKNRVKDLKVNHLKTKNIKPNKNQNYDQGKQQAPSDQSSSSTFGAILFIGFWLFIERFFERTVVFLTGFTLVEFISS